MTIETLIFAAVTILAVVALLLHLLLVIIIAAGIASIDSALFIIMYLADISVDSTSFICITLSIGFSVDYGVHIVHAFEQCNALNCYEKPAMIERLTKTLIGVGNFGLKDGISTSTGIFVLAFSESEPSAPFFLKLSFSTVVLGLCISLVFFPTCAVLIGT